MLEEDELGIDVTGDPQIIGAIRMLRALVGER